MKQPRKEQPLKDFGQLGQALGHPNTPQQAQRQGPGQGGQGNRGLGGAGGHGLRPEGGSGSGTPPRRPAPPAGGGAQDGLPLGYLQTLRTTGYFDEHGYIKEGFIVDYPMEIASALEAGRMTRSLLRTFYNEVADAKQLLRGGRPFDAVRPRILKLSAFAANAVSRRNSPAPSMFQTFVAENARVASQDQSSFLDGFCQHFECVVLYFKGR